MSARSLHKLMRDRVRRELRSSPVLWNEYARRRWAVRKARALVIADRIAVFLGFVFMPSVCGLFLAGMVHDDPAPGEPAAAQPSPLWSLACLAVWQVGCCLFLAGHLLELIWRSVDLPKVAHFPVSDRLYYRWQLGRFYRDAAFVAITSAVVLGTLAKSHHATAMTWAGVALFCLVQWLTVAASAILVVGYHRRPINIAATAVIGLCLIFGSIFVAMGGGRFPTLDATAAWLTFILCPTGWLNAAFYYGVIGTAPIAWLFLVPVAAVVILAARWSLSSFTIREIGYVDNKLIITVIDSAAHLASIESSASQRRKLPNRALREHAISGGEASAPPRTGGDFLRPLDWASLGLVERFVAPRLTDRQRLLLEFSRPGPPAWTLLWKESFLPATASCAVLWWTGSTNEEAAAEMLIAFLNWGAAITSISHGGSTRGNTRPWHAYFPVGFRELTKAGLAQAIWRSAVGLPVIFGFNLAGTLLGGGRPHEAFVRVAACYLVVFAWYLFGRCLFASSSANDTANRRVLIGWTGMILLLGSLSIVCFLRLGLYQVISGAAALFFAWAMWRRYAWLLDHGAIDIVR